MGNDQEKAQSEKVGKNQLPKLNKNMITYIRCQQHKNYGNTINDIRGAIGKYI